MLNSIAKAKDSGKLHFSRYLDLLTFPIFNFTQLERESTVLRMSPNERKRRYTRTNASY